MRFRISSGASGPPGRSRVLSVVTLGAVIAGTALVAAGASSATVAAKVSPSSVKLAYIYEGTAEDFSIEMNYGAEWAAQKTGITLYDAAPASVGDTTTQVSDFESAESTSKNGIALETLFPNLFVSAANTAVASGIPVIAVDTPPLPGENITTFIGNSNTQLGVALADQILPKIPKKSKGTIVIGTDTPGLIVLVLRNKGFEKTVHAARPGVKFVSFDSTQAPATNLAAWTAAVQAHPHALAFVGPGSQDATSMAEIERTTHKHYLVGADDLDPVALQGIKDGLVQCLISPEHWLKGYIAIHLLAEHAINGTPIPKGWWNPGFLVVNKSNIKEILARQKTAATRAAWFKKEADYELAHPSKYIKPLADAN